MKIKARLPLAEAARRLGQSVETLVSTYIGAMGGDDAEANSLIDAVLAKTAAAGRRQARASRRPHCNRQAEQQVPPLSLMTRLANCSVSPVLTYHSQRAPSGPVSQVSVFWA